MWFRKYRLETSFKCDNTTTSIKHQIVKTCYLISRVTFSKCVFVLLFFVSVTKQTLENVFCCSLLSQISALYAILKFSTAAEFENSVIFLRGSHCCVIGTCIFMPENET